jgi:hypothetical protein
MCVAASQLHANVRSDPPITMRRMCCLTLEAKVGEDFKADYPGNTLPYHNPSGNTSPGLLMFLGSTASNDHEAHVLSDTASNGLQNPWCTCWKPNKVRISKRITQATPCRTTTRRATPPRGCSVFRQTILQLP